MSKKILFAASECAPFVKTGGLADVAAALPVQLREMGADIRVVLPLYAKINGGITTHAKTNSLVLTSSSDLKLNLSTMLVRKLPATAQ